MKPIINFDDKDLAIIGLTLLGVLAIRYMGINGESIIPLVITAIAALATGRKNGNGGTPL